MNTSLHLRACHVPKLPLRAAPGLQQNKSQTCYKRVCYVNIKLINWCFPLQHKTRKFKYSFVSQKIKEVIFPQWLTLKIQKCTLRKTGPKQNDITCWPNVPSHWKTACSTAEEKILMSYGCYTSVKELKTKTSLLIGLNYYIAQIVLGHLAASHPGGSLKWYLKWVGPWRSILLTVNHQMFAVCQPWSWCREGYKASFFTGSCSQSSYNIVM